MSFIGRSLCRPQQTLKTGKEPYKESFIGHSLCRPQQTGIVST